MMAKQSLKYTPLGPFMTMSGAVTVDRGNNARAVQTLITAGETMKAYKTSLYMFPEGTRTSQEEPDMLPLKKGGFHLALQAGLPIIPIVAENYWRLYHKGLFASGTIKVRGMSTLSADGSWRPFRIHFPIVDFYSSTSSDFHRWNDSCGYSCVGD
jgi:lysophosphatidate acyltransferase